MVDGLPALGNHSYDDVIYISHEVGDMDYATIALSLTSDKPRVFIVIHVDRKKTHKCLKLEGISVSKIMYLHRRHIQGAAICIR